MSGIFLRTLSACFVIFLVTVLIAILGFGGAVSGFGALLLIYSPLIVLPHLIFILIAQTLIGIPLYALLIRNKLAKPFFVMLVGILLGLLMWAVASVAPEDLWLGRTSLGKFFVKEWWFWLPVGSICTGISWKPLDETRE